MALRESNQPFGVEMGDLFFVGRADKPCRKLAKRRFRAVEGIVGAAARWAADFLVASSILRGLLSVRFGGRPKE
jgi:hypothetical protein